MSTKSRTVNALERLVIDESSPKATISRWTRAFVAVGVFFFVCFQAAALFELSRSAIVALGLNGFVFHVVFGKAYGLIPSYFARDLAIPLAPAVHLPIAGIGTIAMALGASGLGPTGTETTGIVLWSIGCIIFVGTIALTIRDNPSGRDTGTGSVDEHRLRTDRVANAAIPVVLLYLLVGVSLAVQSAFGGPGPTFAVPPPVVSHVLGAGTATLLVFAIGFRLLPRLLSGSVHPILVAIVMPAGVVAPAILALYVRNPVDHTFRIGAVLQAVAIIGYAIAVVRLYRSSARRRSGGGAIAAGALFGVGTVTIGVSFAYGTVGASALEAHVRLALAGFLGLTIVGVTYQLYPPRIATRRGIDDRTASVSVLLLVLGLAVEVVGVLFESAVATVIGRSGGLLGAVLYGFVLGVVLLERGR